MESGLLTRRSAATRIDLAQHIEDILASVLAELPEKDRVAVPGRDAVVYRFAKRALDISVSILALLLAGPMMAAIAIAIKIESKGPVFFGHLRLGRHGEFFRCLKFRSMRPGAQEDLFSDPSLKQRYVDNDYKLPLDEDPRVTRLGRFLRRSSFDELPQLFNVLAGTMSLVGPRPIVREELEWYGEEAPRFLSVKPGLTGVWQIQGRSRIHYPNRTSVELNAIEDRSFWRDLKVLAKSVPAVIMARGSL
jgi:lipopolysaccharide/colanic/teichoic acid biosynthesis glycosyltransferase